MVNFSLEAVREWLFSAISASGSDFNPQNTQCIPAVKIFAFLDLAKNFSFSDSLVVALRERGNREPRNLEPE